MSDVKVLWDASAVESIGRSRQMYFLDYQRRAARASVDGLRDQRHAMRECRFCFYVSHGMAGQAFTEYQCGACKKFYQHPSTSVPKLCDDCADKFEACVRCGGKREWEPLPLQELQSPRVRPRKREK